MTETSSGLIEVGGYVAAIRAAKKMKRYWSNAGNARRN